MTSTLCRLSLLIAISLTILGVDRAAAAPIPVGTFPTWLYHPVSSGCPTCHPTVTLEPLSSTSIDHVDGVNVLTAIGLDTTSTLSGVGLLDQSVAGGNIWAAGGNIWELGHGVGSGKWDIGLVTDIDVNDGLDNLSNLADSGYVIIGGSSIEGSTTTSGGTADLSVVTVPEPAITLLVAAGLIGMRRLRRASPKGVSRLPSAS